MVNKLKDRREAKNLSQSKLSEISGVSRPTIIKLEKGEEADLRTSTLVKLADALETTVSDIFF